MPKGIPNKTHTGEFKQMVVESMQKGKLSYKEAMRKYGIKGHHSVQDWERIYLEEGAEGLYIERRGRACKSSGAQKGKPPKLNKKVEEDLIAEVQRLRAEVAYLKKLNALVSKEEHQNRNHK